MRIIRVLVLLHVIVLTATFVVEERAKRLLEATEAEAREALAWRRPSPQPTLIFEHPRDMGVYALGTRCAMQDCRLWHVGSADRKTSIRYDRDTGQLWLCGPLDVSLLEPAGGCAPLATDPGALGILERGGSL